MLKASPTGSASGRFRVAIHAALWAGSSLLAGCREEVDSATPSVRPSFARGDRVVVEEASAEFFAGRVLGDDDAGLRVQTHAAGEPRVVAPSDVYRVPPEPWAMKPGDLAICGRGDGWTACRIVQVDAKTVAATTPDARAFETSSEKVLRPTQLTRMNLEARFRRAARLAALAKGFSSAGHPKRPDGWRPVPKERLVARLGDEWFTARLVEYGDGENRVATEDDPRGTWIPDAHIIPFPRSARRFSENEFALARPPSPSAAWQLVRVVRIHTTDIVVVNEEGNERRMTARDLLKLGDG